MLQRLLGILIAVLVAVWVLGHPAQAGNTVHSWITGIVTFFTHVMR